jgi:cardiolipin synthase
LWLNPLRQAEFGFFFGRPNKRDHRKVLIVDGRIAILGGIDVSDHYVEKTYRQVESGQLNPKKGAWHDMDVPIEGSAVAEFQRRFLRTWRLQQGPELTGDYFPRLPEQGNERVRILTVRPGTVPNPIHDPYPDAIRNATSSSMRVRRVSIGSLWLRD